MIPKNGVLWTETHIIPVKIKDVKFEIEQLDLCDKECLNTITSFEKYLQDIRDKAIDKEKENNDGQNEDR